MRTIEWFPTDGKDPIECRDNMKIKTANEQQNEESDPETEQAMSPIRDTKP